MFDRPGVTRAVFLSVALTLLGTCQVKAAPAGKKTTKTAKSEAVAKSDKVSEDAKTALKDGLKLMSEGKGQEAEAKFSEAIKLSPNLQSPMPIVPISA